jgi:hypothetical protein
VTTPAAARLYQAQHLLEMEGRRIAIFNPHDKPVEDLPVIYGFNNGGRAGFYSAQLLAEDGTALGGHLCSAESYMPHDLGILEGCRPDRHEYFREHYPDGYRMEFVSSSDVEAHPGLNAAYQRNQAKAKQEGEQT